MALLAFGVNHAITPVALRERLVFGSDDLGPALQGLHARRDIREVAILSTCNRTDLYCSVEPENGAASATEQCAAMTDWFGGFHGVSPNEIRRHTYNHHASSAVRHVMRVASGLDSLVLGETQILGQLKSAYRAAMHQGTVGAVLDRLFREAFSVAKRVRSDTAIGSCPVSVASAAVTLSKQMFGNLSQSTALLVGAGETINLVARHLQRHGVRHFIVANRTVDKARQIAAQLGGYAIGLDELASHLWMADILVSATSSPSTLISVDDAERAISERRRRPMFMIDLAVPLDVESRVGYLEDVYLYTVDDLHTVVRESLESRRAAAGRAERIIDSQVDGFMEWLGTRNVSPVIREVREHAERARDDVHAKAKRLLARGQDPAEVIDYLAHALTNKLMHPPTLGIRRAGAKSREDVIAAARALYDLPPNPRSTAQVCPAGGESVPRDGLLAFRMRAESELRAESNLGDEGCDHEATAFSGESGGQPSEIGETGLKNLHGADLTLAVPGR